MKKMYRNSLILSSAIGIALAGTASTVLAGNSNFLNGKPFRALNDSIQVNADAIADNATAIDAMAAEVDTLFTQVAAIGVRVTANETSIVDAMNQVSTANSDIGALRKMLFGLQADVSKDIASIRAELLTIQGDISMLTGNLATLSSATAAQVDLLKTAIANNSSEIAFHTANLSILNSNMSTVQNALIRLQGQVAKAEIDLANQQNSINNLLATLGSVDVRVTALESLNPDSDVREITITDTGSADDLTNAGVKKQLTSLSLQLNDYLYIYGTGVNGVTEICTNDVRAKQAIDGFIGGYSSGNSGNYSSNTWLKRDAGWIFSDSHYTHMRSYASGSYQWLSFYVYISGGSQWGQIYVRPSDTSSYELYVSGWGYGQQQTATYRAASTRLDACGF